MLTNLDKYSSNPQERRSKGPTVRTYLTPPWIPEDGLKA